MQKNGEYQYKFSVIMPIYNTEKYIEEAIDSVVNQTIGFRENIQIILVNDGSTDNSKEICMKYVRNYPENIVYVEQENAGVSAARNNGIKYIRGKYTNFLDSDDKWDINAFKTVYDFFEKNKEKINIVACRQKFFDAREDYHLLDYKFTGDRVVNILKDYDNIQLHITAVFINSNILPNYKFDEEVKFSEDSKFITEILLDMPFYGIMKSALHFYRKREDFSSAIQGKTKSLEWYFDTPKKVYMKLIAESEDKYKKVIRYIQYFIMYDMQWRLKEKIYDTLNEHQLKEYKDILSELLKYVDDNIICQQPKITSEYKVYALSLKYKRNVAEELKWINNSLYFNDIEVYNLKNKSLFKIELIEINKKYLEIEGEINCLVPKENYNIYALGIKIYPIEYLEDESNNREAFGKTFLKNRRCKIKIPIHDKEKIRIMFKYKNEDARRLTLTLGKFARLNFKSYMLQKKYIIRIKDNMILINKSTKKLHLKCEMNYLKYLLKNKELNICIYRILYYIFRKILKRPIWIISDRVDSAGDNGEAFYKYLVRNEKKAKLYFTIKKDCQDYKRINKIGKVLKYNSVKYKLYFLLSELIISSQANEWTINAFSNKERLIKDLYKFKFVFLQHGIIKDDLSSWLRKYNKNIALFVTSTIREYESIINGNYMYTPKEVVLTGLPRYDLLENKTTKKIIFMPTWRKSLQGKVLNGGAEYSYNERFKNSDYFMFYQRLINDDRIINCLKRNNYKGKFFVHTIFKKQAKDFIGNDLIEIIAEKINYSKELKEAELFITDYSSIAFDFAYLKKPILYIQFDKKEFFEQHTYEEGYFDYEKDGFGPVCYEYEEAINDIINIIERGCKQEEYYRKREDKFFYFEDKNNCERVYNEILKLGGKI